MRANLIAAAALPLVLLLAPERASSAEPTPAGLWQVLDDDTKEPTGWFIISDHNGVFDGIIARMFFKPGENPNVVCSQCTDDRRDHPWLGLEIIRGMKPEGGDKFGGGTILDPRDGKTYHATMKIAPDGQTLIVRGYLGFELLGQNQYWTRLPDSAYSALDPAVNPIPPAKSAPNLPAPVPLRKSQQLPHVDPAHK
jgi:hypothetical protein